jgi:uncharacterized protein DUF4236
MGFRFRRRLTLFPGFSLNLGRSGLTSVSVGTRCAHYTVGRRGARATVGIPGSGFSYTATTHHHRGRPAARRRGSFVLGLCGIYLYYLLFRWLAGGLKCGRKRPRLDSVT